MSPTIRSSAIILKLLANVPHYESVVNVSELTDESNGMYQNDIVHQCLMMYGMVVLHLICHEGNIDSLATLSQEFKNDPRVC